MKTKNPRIPAQAALACLFSSLCCAGALITLPFGPVPLVLTNLFAVLGGLLLGPFWGSLSSLGYLAIGALGFPVFSGGRGGLAHLAGPTGGYLAGYVVAALLAGMIARRRGALASALGAVIGFASILALGSLGLKALSGMSWGRAFSVGVFPFLPWDAVKAVLAATIAFKLGPFLDSLTGRNDARA
jgi:biotin transport system substrate-specific component